MPIVPIRNSNAYLGFGKQTVQGTAVAPTLFPRWLDGSNIDIAMKVENIREGDGTRRLAQVIKNQQYAKIKLMCYPRPVEIGFLECAAMGSGADAPTAVTAPPATTTTTTITGGTSTSVTITSGTGYFGTGGGTYQIAIGAGAPGEVVEVVTFTYPVTPGTTLTVAAGYNAGKFKFNHTIGASVSSFTTINTALTTATTAGGTTVITGNALGLTSGGTQTVMLSPGLAVEEIVTLTVPGTGTGPFTYTVAAAGTTKNVHSIGDVVVGTTLHAMKDQTDGAFYTVEVGLGSLFGSAGTTLRFVDCKVETVKRSSKAGMLLQMEVDLIGIASVVQASPAVVTLENHAPFYYTSGVWTLDGSLTGDAPYVESFDIQQKNNMDVSIQSEKITLDAVIFGNVDVSLTYHVIFQNPARFYLAYFGSSTLPGTGATDVQAIGAGALILVFSQVDGFHSLTYTCPTLHYTKVTPPVPKVDGKHMLMGVTAEATSNQGANLNVLSTIVANSQAVLF
jgi:hypothetical protein